MRYCGLLPVTSAIRSRESDWDRRDSSCPFFLPPDRHTGFVATALPTPHAALASLPPPPFPQPLPSHSSVPPPMPSLPFAHESYPSLAPPSVSLPCSMPSMLPSTSQSYPNAVAGIAGDSTDRETLLKAASRQRFTETSGIKIRAFLVDAELFLRLCSRSRHRWGFFVLAWLGSEEADKVRRSHVVDTVASYEKFRDGLIALFGRFEFEGAYRATLRGLRQSGSESVAAYAARTTDLCSHAYAEFSTEAQMSLAFDHFIAGLADSSSREYLQRE